MMITISIRTALVGALMAASATSVLAQFPAAALAPGPSSTGAGTSTKARPLVAPVSGPRLFAATTDGGAAGALVELLGEIDPTGAPAALDVLAPTDGARHLRRFGGQLFVVNRSAGTVRRVPLNGGASQLYDLGSGSEPMDVFLTDDPGVAWVCLRNNPILQRLDLASGTVQDGVDLSSVGSGAQIALGTMIRHEARLFVQVRVVGAQAVPGGDGGVLAVIDLQREALIDLDAGTEGGQGIPLLGAPPRFDMQILGNTLFVSTTESFNDVRGGIERIDLTTFASTGYAVSEATGHSDMGGFVMVDETRGYYVFHTDLLASTHLVSFTVAGGPEPGSLMDLLGDTVDQLLYDGDQQRLYLPSGFSTSQSGLYVFSTETNGLLGPPVSTVMRPHDVLLVDAPVPITVGL